MHNTMAYNIQYKDKDGNNRRIVEIVADNLYFGDSKPANSAPAEFAEIDDEDVDLPF